MNSEPKFHALVRQLLVRLLLVMQLLLMQRLVFQFMGLSIDQYNYSVVDRKPAADIIDEFGPCCLGYPFYKQYPA